MCFVCELLHGYCYMVIQTDVFVRSRDKIQLSMCWDRQASANKVWKNRKIINNFWLKGSVLLKSHMYSQGRNCTIFVVYVGCKNNELTLVVLNKSRCHAHF